MSKPGFSFLLSDWNKYQTQIKNIRESVFVNELGLSCASASQSTDAKCFHVLAYDGDGNTIGTGSINPDGEISHIAVLRPWRGRTVGKSILIFLLQIAKTLHLPGVWVDAFKKNEAFYQSKEFQLTDKVSTIDGMQKQRLVLELSKAKKLH